jgi:hypothetical protein
MINGFTLHETTIAPTASPDILKGVQKTYGFVPSAHRALAESPAALEAYNHLAQTLFDPFMKDEWTAPKAEACPRDEGRRPQLPSAEAIRAPTCGEQARETEMIGLYYRLTPNGHKITMFLEKAGLGYAIRPVARGEPYSSRLTQGGNKILFRQTAARVAVG